MKQYVVKAACNTSGIPAKVDIMDIEASTFESKLNKLGDIISNLYNGYDIELEDVQPDDNRFLVPVYYDLSEGESSSFTSEKAKEVLEYCGFEISNEGDGYIVYPD